MIYNNQKGIVHLLALVLIITGIIVGVFLVQNPQIFSPKAYEAYSNSTQINNQTFRLQNPKSELEMYFNPFGENWMNKRFVNPDIPVTVFGMYDRTKGSNIDRSEREKQFNRFLPEYFTADPWNVYPKPDVDYYLDLRFGQDELIKKATVDLAFVSGGNGRGANTLRTVMPVQKIINREIKEINPKLKIGGSYVMNMVEIPDLVGYDLPEWGFVHRNGTDPTKKENRLVADPDTYRYIIDVTIPEVQEHIASEIAKAMTQNGLDAVFIDYSGYPVPPKLLNNEPSTGYPQYYRDNYFNGILQSLGKIKQKLDPLGKEVLFNPIQPDALDEKRLTEVKQLLAVTHGTYWEDPFKVGTLESRQAAGSSDQHFDMLQKFFDAAVGKRLTIETNTFGSLSTVKDINFLGCQPMFRCEYQKALEQFGYNGWLKEEQRIARMNLGLFLLFMTDPKYNYLRQFSLMEEVSYEHSEDFHADWDLRIGTPQGKRIKIASGIHKRDFAKGQVWVNYSDNPYTITSQYLPCDQNVNGYCKKNSLSNSRS